MKVIQDLQNLLKTKENVRMRIRLRNPFSPLCSWNFWETWTSDPREEQTPLTTWEKKDGEPLEGYAFGNSHQLPCYLPGRGVECCMHDWQLGLLLDPLFFFKGASWCESLCFSHGSCESSREPEPAGNARSLIQADVLLWPRNLGKRIVMKLLRIWLPFF